MEGAGWGHRHRERGRAEARTLACLPDVLIEKSFRNLSHCNGLLQKFEPFYKFVTVRQRAAVRGAGTLSSPLAGKMSSTQARQGAGRPMRRSSKQIQSELTDQISQMQHHS